MSDANADFRLTAVDYDPFAAPELARAVPTSDAQREVWLADRLGTEASLAFNESVILNLQGPLDVQALQDALLALADRHEALRATFDAEGDNMLIAPRGQLQAAILDLGDLTPDARAARLSALREQAVREPFDLVQGPLVRASLVRLAAEQHELLITAHHIVCDGWSFGVIARELTTLYGAFSEGRGGGAALPSADSFGDYALALLEPEQVQSAEADERYWVSQFDSGAPVLDLPLDRPRPHRRSFASAREDHVLPAALVEGARRLGAARGVSLFGTLFGLFAGLMNRLGGEGDVVVGVPSAGQAVHGRPLLVGHCVNLLPIRLTPSDAQTVEDLLKSAGSCLLDAYDHQHCTFARLLSRLNLAREANRLPLVSVQFNLDTPLPDAELSTDRLAVSLRSNPRAFENFELFVNASQVDGAIVLECQYSRELFDAETVRRWLRLYELAIERAIASPTQAVCTLWRASPEDESRSSGFNQTRRDFPADERIETLVAAQAARTPQAEALVCGTQTLTYAQLEARAQAVAGALRERGVGRGDRVGMACGRNPHLLAAMLGILKTGAAYVPLDPAFPAERLAYMVADAGLSCVVSDRSVSASAWADTPLLLVDDLGPAAAAVETLGHGDEAAYVIYTSGSTGKPKGVAVPQRAVVNFLTSMAERPGLAATDRLVAVTTTSFDIAVLELFLPLTTGGCVILADRDTVLDGVALRALLESQRATVMQATPAGWRLLLDAGWTGGPAFKALVGGEALPEDLADQLCQRTGQTWNMYGPTETTVWSTCWRVPAQRAGIRIGQPIGNTQVVVLDERLQPCPIGVPGELFIGGEGVAIGYWNREALTEERFPILAGERLYRTGDRGRWRNDGTLEHLGRLDFQVKVRGYRIELGEIESALLGGEGVERAVVLAREDQPGDVRLVAYVVAAPGAVPDGEALRSRLRSRLPDYMVPAHVVVLPAIPLLPNGKINRLALPRPLATAAARSAPQPAATVLEAKVQQAMAGVLNLGELGVEDDFFAMGGHSMLAARLVAALNKALDLKLPLRSVFEHSTPRRLAGAIELLQASARPAGPPLLPQPDQSRGPLTLMQERIRFMEEMQPGRVVYNTPSAHRLKGPLDLAAFETAVRRLVARQPALRTRIVKDEAGARQEVLGHVELSMGFEDLSAEPAATREATLMRRLQLVIDRPMELARAPLFRAALFRLAPEEHVFLFMPHHIVWDGWSFDLLYQEMAELYPAAIEARPDTLPPVPVSLIDFACWHQAWMAGDECRAQIAWWKQRYAAVPALRALPTDRPRQPNMSGIGAVEWVHIDRTLTERLRDIGREAGVTLNMLVLAVYAAMMSRTVEGDSLVIGIPVRGRADASLESVMGFFNNLLPLPLEIDSALPMPAWLARVRQDLTGAFAHQDVPFERLATEPEVARASQRAGLYQTLFSFQDARERRRHWGPLAHESVLVMQKGATEDLGLWLMEVPAGLEGGINYNADLFDVTTIRIFRQRLLGLLQRLAQAPASTLGALLEQPGEDADAFAAWVDRRHGRHAPPGPAAAAPMSDAGGDSAPTAPDTVARLAAIWSELLGVPLEQIGPQDNFFDLGGSSLLAMRVVAEAETRLGLKVDAQRYVYETLGQICAGAATTAAVAEGVAPISPAAPPPATASAAVSPAAQASRLAALWAELLGLDPVHIGVDDNFFDLGGSSLLAMRAVAEAEARLGLKVDAQRYVYETLGQLCAPAAAAPAAAAAAAEALAAPATAPGSGSAGAGLLSRVFGRLGRRN